MHKSAVISSCGTYRYVLRRIWDPRKQLLVFVMLNPSTADAEKDDATIRKCIGFAKHYGFGGILVVNLFGLRSRDPKALRVHPAPIGVDNDRWIVRTVADRNVIVAWGRNAEKFPTRVRDVVALIRRPVRALRITKEGHPEHPVMLPYNLVPQPWRPGVAT